MMNGLPGLDVVIATHHRPEMLREAVAAVLDQTYAGHIHCRVVFDRSEPDSTMDLSTPLRTVETLSNYRTPGLAGARNSGILAGASDLIAFCDDDDLWLPTKVERQVHQMERDGEPTSVTGIWVDYQGRSISRVPRSEELTVAELARKRVMAAHPSTVMVRRDRLLADIGLVDEQIPGSYGEDYDWILRAAAIGGFAVVPQPLVRVRWGGSQFSHQWSTIVAAIDHLLVKHPVFQDDRRALARLYGQRAFALAAQGKPRTRQAVLETLRTSPREPRGYLAAAVAVHAVSADRVLDLAHRRGRGI